MQGHRIGYVRVSSFDQNPERQLEQTQVSKVFTDKASGKDTQRPQLEALLSFVREGDTVVVHSMDRLARNLDDLRRLVQKLTQRGVRIEFLKEGLVAVVPCTGFGAPHYVRWSFAVSMENIKEGLDRLEKFLAE